MSRSAWRESVSVPYTGVTRATPARRSRACSMSRRLGAVLVAKPEDLSKYLANRSQRIELPTLHLAEQPPQLWVVRHRALEIRLRAGRGDREDLAGEVFSPLRLEKALGLEKRPVSLDLRPQLGH